jgi:hypothetical protein
VGSKAEAVRDLRIRREVSTARAPRFTSGRRGAGYPRTQDGAPVLLYGDFEILSKQHILVRSLGGDATARVREGNLDHHVEIRVQAGSNGGLVRHRFAFRVQIGSKSKTCKSRVFSATCL